MIEFFFYIFLEDFVLFDCEVCALAKSISSLEIPLYVLNDMGLYFMDYYHVN